ncbi:hypothetical protein AMTR_s00007p00115770 [Amborella trichopoda]|uniref:PHD-type domain-containing protein n=1 Tax=Amborella trichopoda TaxID=13333 RepID=W1PDY3_AMBTC|nr:hypothetical protein AMTR_s00007p00115770 [Amborella trichopoda]
MTKKRKQVSKVGEGFESTERIAKINGLRTCGCSSLHRYDLDFEDNLANEERQKEAPYRLPSQITGRYSERDEGNEMMGILEREQSETPWIPEVSSEVERDEVELEAEYCPETITEYFNLKSQRGNKRGLLQEMMKKAKMHLLASGWKLERRLATQHRYFSPSGKVTDENIRPSVSEKPGLIKKVKDLKPVYSPVALRYYLLLFKSDISEGQKIKIGKWMAPKVMEHLLAVGWSLSYTVKKLREFVGLVQGINGSKMRDSSITKKSIVRRDTRISKEKINRKTRKAPVNRKFNLTNSAPPPSSWPPLSTSTNRELDLANSVPPPSSFALLCSNSNREFDSANSVPPPPLCSNVNKELDLSNSVSPPFSLSPLCTTGSSIRKKQRQRHLTGATDRQGDKTFKASSVSQKNMNQSGLCHGEDSCVKGEARVTRVGIKCNCCSEVYRIADFEAHVKTPSTQIFVEDGRSLYDCQRQMLDQSALKDLRLKSCDCKKADYNQYKSDEICSICHYGGELVLCDCCPSAYHLSCLHLKDFPEGDWFYPSCSCAICGRGESNADSDQFTAKTFVYCEQCERNYHVGCCNERGPMALKSYPKGN